ncbi:hypothetical protein [Nocardia bhagyanarayanae]|uniref:Uncharacterized protein n=1 Tax=Nocardia bhagyanarayanae TaxID=1215925 RepID=A0A543FGL2_9NOCA|nr:hypothetical protein [Nocardia bhagyanarayanae]TQM32912.1 hypothetical protein FB390_4615 [Nocardia bhagyanarayanae]
MTSARAHEPHGSSAPPAPARPTPTVPPVLGFSALLGGFFAAAWFGYTAVRAEDGRNPVTDWLDPMLAAATVTLLVVLHAVVILLWAQLPAVRATGIAVAGLVAGQWMYITGEVLSNTITIGEPPQDVGSLLEIAGGVATLAAALCLGIVWARRSMSSRAIPAVGAIAAVAVLGMAWWLTHPIDQSLPGAPECVPGNPIYNITHGRSC